LEEREKLFGELKDLVAAAEVLEYDVAGIKEWIRLAERHASVDDMKARIRELEMKPFKDRLERPEAGALNV
jgi:hypothetical protein